VTIRIRYRILNARLAAGAVSAGQGGGVDQTYDGWRGVSQLNFSNGVMGWTAPDGIDCARMRSLQISNKGDRPWNRLAELAWTRRNIFSSFMG